MKVLSLSLWFGLKIRRFSWFWHLDCWQPLLFLVFRGLKGERVPGFRRFAVCWNAGTISVLLDEFREGLDSVGHL